MELARRHGDQPQLLVERGRSGAARAGAFGGTGRGGKRRIYTELVEAIGSGAITTLYAYSLSRLGRSTKAILELFEICAEQGVTVHLAKEGTIDWATPYGRLYLTILGAVATLEAEMAAERRRDTIEAKRNRGEYVGRAPYGQRIDATSQKLVDDPEEQRTLAAMIALGDIGYEAIARELNAQGHKPRHGQLWGASSVRRTLKHAQGERIASDNRAVKGASYKVRAFTKLLRCSHCGTVLTAHSTNRPGRNWTGWFCRTRLHDPDHPKVGSLPDALARELLEAEAARMRVPVDRIQVAEQAQDQLRELEARRTQLLSALEYGNERTRQDVRQRLEQLQAEEQRLEAHTILVDVPQAVDWSWPDPELNAVLGALWDHVSVDLTTRTITEVAWTDPGMRRPADLLG